MPTDRSKKAGQKQREGDTSRTSNQGQKLSSGGLKETDNKGRPKGNLGQPRPGKKTKTRDRG